MRKLAQRLPLDSEDQGRIDLTSLVDVVFLLIIFFVLGTTVRQRSEIEIELPSAQGTPATGKKTTRELEVDKGGRMFWQGGEVAADSTLRLGGEQEVVLRADKESRHQDVVKALDLLRRSGATGVRVEVKKP